MRFGQLRGVTLALGLFSATLVAREAAADGIHYTIPREVLARDLNTGGPYFAPPVPWGCYAKDGIFDSFYPKACIHGLFNHGCGGGSGLFGKGCGRDGCGLGGKLCGRDGCGSGGKGCGGDGCGSGGKGCGLFGHKACGDPGCGSGCGKARRIRDCGLCKNKGCGLCQSSVAGDPLYVAASPQTTTPVIAAPVGSPQGGVTMLCDTCTGKGCGKCGFGGLLHRGAGDPCGTCGNNVCGGKGCGLFGHGGGNGDPCNTCGKRGCNLFGHGSNGGDGCNNCGGKGCGLCNGLGNHMKGKLAGLLHHKKGGIKYFVGPGGPVPLTPGYVPYTVTTRSPRDFLAFPPYTPSEY